MKVLYAYHTDTGTTKSINQDSLIVKEKNTDQGKVLFAVLCDGMGGMDQGEVASATAIEECSNWFSETFPISSKEFSQNEIVKRLKALFMKVNKKIYNYGIENHLDMGTTLTVFLLVGESTFIIGHIGDTRVYRIKRRVSVLTVDHTFVGREVRRGTMTEKQARNDSRRSILLQCIGLEKEIEPQFLVGEPEENCTYMLCSDGFRNEISERELYRNLKPKRLTDEQTIKAQAIRLVELNKKRQEKDNISTIIICLKKEKKERDV